jgi:DNA polymerase (family 10)
VATPRRLEVREIAAALRETAALLRASRSDPYKVRAYERGARALEALGTDLGGLVESKRLTEIPGIGERLAGAIEELHRTGRSAQLDHLRASVPGDALTALADRPILLRDGLRLEDYFVPVLRRLPGVRRAAAAGDVRRRLEIAERLDLVVESETPAASIEAFLALPQVATGSDATAVAASDAPKLERSSVDARLLTGERVRLVAAPRSAYAATLLDATGSRAHLEALGELAGAEGVAPGSRGWRRDGRAIEAREEVDLYAAVGLSFIPPELRDGDGEIEAARTGRVPALLVEEDVRGYVHCHTTYSDGVSSVLEMARAAEERGREYITITDHSPTAHYAGGLTYERLKRQWADIAAARRKVRIAVFRGTESDILPDGSLDYPDAVLARLDVIVASLHARNRMDRAAMTRRLAGAMRHPYFKVWGHALGRLLLRRPPADCDVEAVLDALACSRGAVEVNGDPHRLDMEPRLLRRAKARGLSFVVSTDAHSTGDLGYLRYGVAIARRGWLERADVLNTLDAEAFAAAVRPAPVVGRRRRGPRSRSTERPPGESAA